MVHRDAASACRLYRVGPALGVQPSFEVAAKLAHAILRGRMDHQIAAACQPPLAPLETASVLYPFHANEPRLVPPTRALGLTCSLLRVALSVGYPLSLFSL